MLSTLEKKIIGTVAYYDELEYPLTAFEIWKYLTAIDGEIEKDSGDTSLNAIGNALSKENLGKLIETHEGFYFLKGRQHLVERRLMNNKIASLKLKKLRKIVWFLRFLPFVRMIAATGRLAMKNTGKESDWDLFIVLKQGRIWTGRTLLTACVHIMGKRRHDRRVKDRVCLNYFVTTESLVISTHKRPFEVNLFSANEYACMIPLFGFKQYQKFQIRNSTWIKEFKPNFEIPEVRSMNMIADSHASYLIRRYGERICGFDCIENFLRKLETKKIESNPKTHATNAIVSAIDQELVFLPVPQGKEIYERCREKLIALGAYF